jgi:hypothetical protein
MKRVALVLLILLVTVGGWIIATRGERSIEVKVRPFPDDEPHAVPASGEHLVGLAQVEHFFLGIETSRILGCSARTGDPSVTGIRMELFRLGPAGSFPVARTRLIPGNEPIYFEYDIEDEPFGRGFLLRGTFLKVDGTSDTAEWKAKVEDPDTLPR